MSVRKMLLFDIDGTLLLTGGTGALAFNLVFKEMFGVEEAWGNTHPDGKTDPAIIDEVAVSCLGRTLSPAEYKKLCTRYLELFDENIGKSERFRLMPGVPELLEHLSQREDVLLGVATGNFEQAAWSKLERGKIRHYFSFGGFGSDSHHRPELTRQAMMRGHRTLGRELPSRHIFIIGDTPWDVLAGKHIGATTVAITTGSYTAADFEASNPDYIFPDLAQAERFLELLE